MTIELSDRTKLFLRLALFLGATLLIGFALYSFFFAKTPSVIIEEPPQGGETTGGSLPGADEGTSSGTGGTGTSSGGSGQLPPSQVANGGKTVTTELTTSGITSPHITENGTVAYYDPADGRFYTIDENGDANPLSLAAFPSAEDVVFNNDASAVVVEFPDGSNIVYDFDTAEQVTLPSHWEEFSFSTDGSEIASKSVGTDPSNRALVIASADGSSTKVITALGANDDKVSVSWSSESAIVGFSQTGSSTSIFGQHQIYPIGEDGEASGVITVNGTNYQNIWAPNGKFILYSIADAGDDYRPSLWYVDAKGDRNGTTRLRLGVQTTVDRCAFFDDTTLYCGVPTETPAGSGSSTEILNGPDYLYKISLPLGNAELIAIPSVSTVIKNISISTDESILYYTDARDKLNFIRLK
jgi:hypothetical protein